MVKTGFVIGVLFAQFAFAQASPKTDEVLDSLFAVRHYEEAAISPVMSNTSTARRCLLVSSPCVRFCRTMSDS